MVSEISATSPSDRGLGFAVEQPTITGRTRLVPDSAQPLFACDDCTFSSGSAMRFFESQTKVSARDEPLTFENGMK
jgi:hypothetical protein